jgi:hypothetical protein
MGKANPPEYGGQVSGTFRATAFPSTNRESQHRYASLAI